MNSAERKLNGKLILVADRLSQATPGFLLQAYQGGRLKMDMAWGRHWRYYDLASLTKIIFTATTCAQAVAKKDLSPQDLVVDHWSEFRYKNLKMTDLWTHTAGLPWWRPFYKKVTGPMDPNKRWPQISRELLKLKRHAVNKAIYSDPDLLVTSQVLQNIKQQNLQQIWKEYARPEWTGQMHFNIGNQRLKKKSDYAPTEKCLWRKQTMQGQVHDENTYALGGIAPHSGLFGRPEDVARWALMWRKALHDRADSFLPASIAKAFTRRHTKTSVGDWGWLFMKPTAGRASCGKYFSPQSFGHTGFTGTSMWFDPKADLLIIFLSNRVHPTRKNAEFLRWRPWLHEAVCESL